MSCGFTINILGERDELVGVEHEGRSRRGAGAGAGALGRAGAPAAQERAALGWLVSYARMTSACDTLPPSSCEKAKPSTHTDQTSLYILLFIQS